MGNKISRRSFLIGAGTTAAATVAGTVAYPEVKRYLNSREDLTREVEMNTIERFSTQYEQLRTGMEELLNGPSSQYSEDQKLEFVGELSEYRSAAFHLMTGKSWEQIVSIARATISQCDKLLGQLKDRNISNLYLQNSSDRLDKVLSNYLYDEDGDAKLINLFGVLRFVEQQVVNAIQIEAIRKDFGIEVACEDFADIESADIRSLDRSLRFVPPFILKKAGLKKIVYATNRLQEEGAGGQAKGGEVFLRASSDLGVFMHEIGHLLQANPNSDTSSEELDAIWRDSVNQGRPYMYNSGQDAIAANRHWSLEYRQRLAKEYPSLFSAPEKPVAPPGYGSDYGWQGGKQEDMPEINAMLANPDLLENGIFKIFVLGDGILKNKIEIVSGYKLNNPWKCHVGDDIPEAELSARMQQKEWLEHWYRVYCESMKLPCNPEFPQVDLSPESLRWAAYSKDIRLMLETYSGKSLVTLYNFGSKMFDDDYKRFGYRSAQFWGKWSEVQVPGKSISVTCMNESFYNKVLNKNYPRFVPDSDGGLLLQYQVDMAPKNVEWSDIRIHSQKIY